MLDPLTVLKQYWGFDSFRAAQEQVIKNLLDKHDTLALLPTGGGKSVCFQVPALVQEGICIVVSPLVALIQDQVNQLKNKNIKAIGLTGGLSYKEVDALLDNCIYGNYKFLYLSPERLQQELVQERIRQMPVNLIAIDEAHCISEWGHDFRPAYRNCVWLRETFPHIPIAALTASATAEVQEDIVQNLNLRAVQRVKSSFSRQNIAYMVFEEEDKRHKLSLILKKNKGSSIVYVTSRKATINFADFLNNQGIKATFYHGGISSDEKQNKLKLWLDNQIQVMVATNAFGMGIDKPDVRTVIHLNLPDSIENYYQESGRAGRDGKKSFAVILKNKADELQAEEQFVKVFPDSNFLKLLYKKLNNYFQIGYGEDREESFAFNFNEFCHIYQLNGLLTYNGLKTLDRQSIINFTESYRNKVILQFEVSSNRLFSYLDKYPKIETIVQAILRTYGGIFDLPTKINTILIAQKTASSEADVMQVLQQLHKDEIINLEAKNTDAEITFLVPREDDRVINVIAKDIKSQNKLKATKLKAVFDYCNTSDQCKSIQLLTYFGETNLQPCGICSYCITKKHKRASNEVLDIVAEQIIKLLKEKPLSSRAINSQLTFREEYILSAIQILLEDEKIIVNERNEYQFK
ncbi:RecQ family ATP-dependent DNA helicase [Zhouia amylolytica]|uniref:ATP-dependent DNA helicase RecQ n=1 Tax=Zhouia amylolytica AD3 TaxID=1286632 RepID=W2UQT5_9FLAO|nr:ATP-dependent DNA helicase RecQ [Zhouia amylolytica]ETN96299.1 ATP-dependent DNA helicase, RecQ family [Zhouia amylolytica AD3]